MWEKQVKPLYLLSSHLPLLGIHTWGKILKLYALCVCQGYLQKCELANIVLSMTRNRFNYERMYYRAAYAEPIAGGIGADVMMKSHLEDLVFHLLLITRPIPGLSRAWAGPSIEDP